MRGNVNIGAGHFLILLTARDGHDSSQGSKKGRECPLIDHLPIMRLSKNCSLINQVEKEKIRPKRRVLGNASVAEGRPGSIDRAYANGAQEGQIDEHRYMRICPSGGQMYFQAQLKCLPVRILVSRRVGQWHPEDLCFIRCCHDSQAHVCHRALVS